MIFFISFLRAIAACIITNSHYTGVYPTDLIANGGLLGDVIFFAVSGYCLYNLKLGFIKWYGKRVYRVYIPTVIITLIYFLIGFYPILDLRDALSWFIYPTHYHFVASIIVLYIPYYFIIKWKFTKEHLIGVMAVIALIWILVYIFAFDKSYYHVDDVYSNMIRFLFGESMLLGAWFRQNDSKLRNVFKWKYVVGFGALFVIYFISKILFSHYESIAQFQFLNQIILFALLFFLFRVFIGIDDKLTKLPSPIKKVIEYISAITLEIYIVQYALEDRLRNVAVFPVNWIVLTLSILICAVVLHYICEFIYFSVDHYILKKESD